MTEMSRSAYAATSDCRPSGSPSRSGAAMRALAALGRTPSRRTSTQTPRTLWATDSRVMLQSSRRSSRTRSDQYRYATSGHMRQVPAIAAAVHLIDRVQRRAERNVIGNATEIGIEIEIGIETRLGTGIEIGNVIAIVVSGNVAPTRWVDAEQQTLAL